MNKIPDNAYKYVLSQRGQCLHFIAVALCSLFISGCQKNLSIPGSDIISYTSNVYTIKDTASTISQLPKKNLRPSLSFDADYLVGVDAARTSPTLPFELSIHPRRLKPLCYGFRQLSDSYAHAPTLWTSTDSQTVRGGLRLLGENDQLPQEPGQTTYTLKLSSLKTGQVIPLPLQLGEELVAISLPDTYSFNLAFSGSVPILTVQRGCSTDSGITILYVGRSTVSPLPLRFQPAFIDKVTNDDPHETKRVRALLEQAMPQFPWIAEILYIIDDDQISPKQQIETIVQIMLKHSVYNYSSTVGQYAQPGDGVGYAEAVLMVPNALIDGYPGIQGVCTTIPTFLSLLARLLPVVIYRVDAEYPSFDSPGSYPHALMAVGGYDPPVDGNPAQPRVQYYDLTPSIASSGTEFIARSNGRQFGGPITLPHSIMSLNTPSGGSADSLGYRDIHEKRQQEEEFLKLIIQKDSLLARYQHDLFYLTIPCEDRFNNLYPLCDQLGIPFVQGYYDVGGFIKKCALLFINGDGTDTNHKDKIVEFLSVLLKNYYRIVASSGDGQMVDRGSIRQKPWIGTQLLVYEYRNNGETLVIKQPPLSLSSSSEQPGFLSMHGSPHTLVVEDVDIPLLPESVRGTIHTITVTMGCGSDGGIIDVSQFPSLRSLAIIGGLAYQLPSTLMYLSYFHVQGILATNNLPSHPDCLVTIGSSVINASLLAGTDSVTSRRRRPYYIDNCVLLDSGYTTKDGSIVTDRFLFPPLSGEPRPLNPDSNVFPLQMQDVIIYRHVITKNGTSKLEVVYMGSAQQFSFASVDREYKHFILPILNDSALPRLWQEHLGHCASTKNEEYLDLFAKESISNSTIFFSGDGESICERIAQYFDNNVFSGCTFVVTGDSHQFPGSYHDCYLPYTLLGQPPLHNVQGKISVSGWYRDIFCENARVYLSPYGKVCGRVVYLKKNSDDQGSLPYEENKK